MVLSINLRKWKDNQSKQPFENASNWQWYINLASYIFIIIVIYIKNTKISTTEQQQ